MNKHSRSVKKVCFFNDDQYIAVAGLDGILTIWDVPSMLASYPEETQHDSPFRFKQISMSQINDIWCSSATGLSPKVYVACGKMVHVYHVESGSFSIKMTFSNIATAVCVDSNERSVVVGFNNGNICQVDLTAAEDKARMLNDCTIDFKVNSNPDCSLWKVGCHKAEVTVLKTFSTVNALLFVSGSMDNKVKIWKYWNEECLKEIKMASCVQSLHHFLFNKKIFATKSKPRYNLPSKYLPSSFNHKSEYEIGILKSWNKKDTQCDSIEVDNITMDQY